MPRFTESTTNVLLDNVPSFSSEFGCNITFHQLYQFLRKHKEYGYNRNIPHFTCLCEICEDATLLAKGIARACKTKKIATDPRTIVDNNSCDTNSTMCMQGQCNKCSSTDLNPSDFTNSDAESDSDESMESINVQYMKWVKMRMATSPNKQPM